MICPNIVLLNFSMEQSIIREQGAQLVRKEKKIGFSKAWLHHKGRNKHHPEYWLDLDLNDKIYKPVPMPNKYIFESFCDHLAASKVYNKKKFKPQMVWDYYYNKERYYLPIHVKREKNLIFIKNLP